MRYLLSAIAFLLACASVHAEDSVHPIDKWFSQAMKKALSTVEQREVYGQAYKRWDAELNRAYTELQAKLPPDAKEKLKVSQRAWLAWRDKESPVQDAILFSKQSGTLALIVRDQLGLDILRQRALDLEGYKQLLETPP